VARFQNYHILEENRLREKQSINKKFLIAPNTIFTNLYVCVNKSKKYSSKIYNKFVIWDGSEKINWGLKLGMN
jgi:hypothetical protein